MTIKGTVHFAVGVLAVFWAGLLFGVSFLATPIKFQAPSLTLGVALDVGRQTFMALNWVEIFLLALLFGLVIWQPQRRLAAVACLVALIVAAQALWLLPVLDARVQLIMDGGTPAPSILHILYICADLTELALLGVLALIGFRSALSSFTALSQKE